MELWVFYSLGAVALIAALGVVLLRNILHCALLLGVALAAVAGLYASLGADFLFAAQLLIYVTGVAVLILFVVMLSGRSSELSLRQINDQWLAGLILCGVILKGLLAAFGALPAGPALGPTGPTTAALGRLFAGELALPFELISLILIVALVGAVYFSRSEAA